MKISKEMVEYVSELSRLELTESQIEKTMEDLTRILDYVEILNEMDLSGIEPMSHVFDLKNVFREDEVEPSYDREALLSGAPKRDNESFIVPKTVE